MEQRYPIASGSFRRPLWACTVSLKGWLRLHQLMFKFQEYSQNMKQNICISEGKWMFSWPCRGSMGVMLRTGWQKIALEYASVWAARCMDPLNTTLTLLARRKCGSIRVCSTYSLSIRQHWEQHIWFSVEKWNISGVNHCQVPDGCTESGFRVFLSMSAKSIGSLFYSCIVHLGLETESVLAWVRFCELFMFWWSRRASEMRCRLWKRICCLLRMLNTLVLHSVLSTCLFWERWFLWVQANQIRIQFGCWSRRIALQVRNQSGCWDQRR